TKLLREKPELTGTNFQDLREQIAASERSRKQRTVNQADLQKLWNAQLTEQELTALHRLSGAKTVKVASGRPVTIKEAVEWAEEHMFDRNSVVLECQLWQEALGRARGENFSLAELKEFTGARGFIRDDSRPGEVTRRDVLLRESEIVQTVKEGAGACHP